MLPQKLEALSLDLSSLIKEEEITALAIESGYEIQESPLRGFNFFLIHLLGVMDKGMSNSLTDLCHQGQHLGINVANESLNRRYTEKATLFMKKASGLILSKRLGKDVTLKALESFNGVFISDSSSVEIPTHLCEYFGQKVKGKSSSLMKLDCTFDLQSDWSRIWIRYGASSDQTLLMGPPKNSLWLRDLGYYKTADFKGIDYQGGKFISRARMDIPLYLSEEGTEKVELEQLIDELGPNEYYEREVRIGNKQRLPVRLVLQRVPDEVAQKKRKELKAQKTYRSRKVSQRRLNLCALNVFITNLSAQQWRAPQIQELYKIRWQIELIFKIWKSELHLEKVPKMNRHRFECNLYAMLIYITLNHKMIQRFKDYYWNDLGIELSEIKTAKAIKVHKQKLKNLFMGARDQARLFIEVLFEALNKRGRKSVRRANKNPLFNKQLICVKL